jgi:hypothetical protein
VFLRNGGIQLSVRKTTFSFFTAVKISNQILDIFCLNIIRIRRKSPWGTVKP